jgi:hypothetical protein
MKPILRFSWQGLLLAPFFVPFFYSAIFASLTGGNPLFSFLFFFVCGGVFSYATTIFFFLPSLFLLSKLARPTIGVTGILGAVLGVVAYLPLAWMMFLTSGVDSGPPQGTFVGALGRDLFDPAVWAFPFGGLVTAVIYWLFARHQAKKAERAAEQGRPSP